MLNIGVVDSRPRTRTFKELFMLQYKYNCIFMGATTNKQNFNLLTKVKYYRVNGVKDIRKICIKEKIDVLHTHNYPDTYGMWGLKVRKDLKIPVVHEIHDMAYENASANGKKLERDVLPKVDALITVGPAMQKEIKNKYKRESTIIYAYMNKDFMPPIKRSSKGFKMGVYQGGIRNVETKGSKFNHRYYNNIFKSLIKQGLNIDVFPAYPLNPSEKINGVKFMGFEPDMRMLYRKMSAYDFGFVGYNLTKSRVMDMGCPNKMYECVGSGIPILCMEYNEIAKFVRRNGFGVVLNKHTLKLPPNYGYMMTNAKDRIKKNRHLFTMESQMKRLTKLYRSVL